MTHPTRKILEQGGVVDGEAFKIMLEEESQNEILEILKEINQHLVDIDDKINKNSFKADDHKFLNSEWYSDNKKNNTCFNAEKFMNNILIFELCKMVNILYLDCKNEYGFFDEEVFEKISKELYKKISTSYDELVDIYKKL